MLESVTDRVNMVNAPVIARERGIRVVETKSSRSLDFASAITTRVRGNVHRLITGALFHGGQLRIVRIDDFMPRGDPRRPDDSESMGNWKGEMKNGRRWN